MKILIEKLNKRAAERGLTPDITFAYKSFTLDIAKFSDLARELKIRFWVLYHSNYVSDYDPEYAFIRSDTRRLYCDLEGIVTQIESHMRENGEAYRATASKALYDNTSDRIKKRFASDLCMSEQAIDLGFFDDFLSDPGYYPLLLTNIRPGKFKKFSYVVFPFHTGHDPRRVAPVPINNAIFRDIQEMLDTTYSRPISYNPSKVSEQLAKIITQYMRIPDAVRMQQCPVDLSMFCVNTFNPRLDVQHTVYVCDEEFGSVYLEELEPGVYNDNSKIVIKTTVLDANSIISKSE